jgi:hypothetical protein
MSDPSFSAQQRIEAELLLITREIARLTGLPSQWNGRAEIVTAQNTAFGGKSFACLIRVRADIAESDLRWLTMLHEAFHCFSAERNPDASLAYSGYEEGVVEQCQRLFRQEILVLLGVAIDRQALVDRDKTARILTTWTPRKRSRFMSLCSVRLSNNARRC